MDKYISPIENFLKDNDLSTDDPKFSSLMYEITDTMKADGIGFEAVRPILELMERYPTTSFGSPGALVHFIEGFYEKGYEELLEQSVKKTPTVHTVWLLNRLINDATDEKAMEYIEIMKSIYSNNDLLIEIRNRAEDYLEDYE